jgi:kinesin family protein 5
MSDSCNVRVFCRFRPFNQREKDLGEDQGVEINIKPGQVEIVDPTTGRKRDFPMDHCFEGGCHQRDVFDTIALQSVEDIFEGFNGTIFAYGQTGSGKSWSMMGGDKRDADLKGIIPRSADAIFAKAAADQSGTVYSVACSYLQVYKEKIGDLLDPSKNNLQVREDPRSGVYVDGLTQAYVSSMDEVMGVLLKGDSSRAVAATNMNAVSSRSHSVFIVEVTQKTTEGGTKKGRLNLVDLAGSEKVGKTGASGNTLEEAKKINQSLSALGNVIKSLADGRGHVPYRDSKLTRILQSSLGGNTKTSLITAASPHPDNAAETLSTLRFGQRAKTIKTRVKANEQRSAEELAKIVEKLQVELAQLRGYTAALESKLSEVHRPPPPPPHHRCIHPPSLPNVFCCWIRAPLAPRPASFAPAARCCVAQRLCGTSCVCVCGRPPAPPLSLCLSHSHAHSCVYRLASRCPRQRSPPPPPSRRAEG